MLKNKKGFTLVELLVAIAIMISITVVAIISITKIGEQNKKQAYELVKEQVKTAALEYFSSNEYLFEGLNFDDKPTAKISLGKLVDMGYLNSVTNPINSQKLSACTVATIEKTEKGYDISYSDQVVEGGICDLAYMINVSTKNAAEIDGIEYYNQSGVNLADGNTIQNIEWFNATHLGETGNLFIKVHVKDDNSTVSKVTINDNGIINDNMSEEGDGWYSYNLTDNGIFDFTITAISSNGNSSITPSIKKDSISPEVNIFNIEENGSYNGDGYIKVNFSIYEAGNSGVKNVTSNIIDNRTNVSYSRKANDDVFSGYIENGTPYINVEDNAGNVGLSEQDYQFYTSCTQTVRGDYKGIDTCDCEKKGQTLYKYYGLKDKNTGASCSGEYREEFTCNPTDCSVELDCNIDLNISISQDGYNSNTGWYNKDKVELTITPGSNVSYWKWETNESGGKWQVHSEKGDWQKNGKKTLSLSEASYNRQGRITLYNSAGEEKECYTDVLKIDNTPPDCNNDLTITPSGTKNNENNEWYKSKVSLTITPTENIAKYGWFTNCIQNDSDCKDGYKEWTNDNRGVTIKTLSEIDGLRERYGKLTVFDKAGNYRWCDAGTYKIDTTPPRINITKAPYQRKCSSAKAVYAEYTVSDNMSGLFRVADFFGDQETSPDSDNSNLINRYNHSNTINYFFPSNNAQVSIFGLNCNSGTLPSTTLNYRLKYYIEDIAGNVTNGYTEGYSTIGN